MELKWIQTEFSLKPRTRGCHLVTKEILGHLAETEFQEIKVGIAQLFIKHTSASLTINENSDPDVLRDMELAFDHLCPESLPFAHVMEGRDDMPAHVKSSLMGCSLTIPITNGQFNLGTWQGIYLCEHRNHGGSRRVIVTAFGQSPSADYV